MKVILYKAYLDNRLTGEMEIGRGSMRIAYVPKDEGNAEIGERGLPEWVLTYENLLPTSETEPELYGIAHELEIKSLQETWLKFKDATVILISKEEDDKFRRENAELLKRIEAFCIE